MHLAFIGAEHPQLPIEDNTYDVITIAGGMAQNLIPCSAIHEMIRLTKPGGYIVNVFREEVLNNIEEYKDKLEPLMKSLEQEKKWRLVTRELYPGYLVDKTGIVFIHQVC